MQNYKNFLAVKETYEIKVFERKKELANMRFDLAVKLKELMDKLDTKRHNERCQILGIKYSPDKKSIAKKILRANAIR